jgi:hypothetical protein
MNQGLGSAITQVMELVRSSGLLCSLCTISVPPGVFNAAGAPDPSVPYIPLAGHINIPCMAPPTMIGDMTFGTEKKEETQIEAVNTLHVLLDNCYPAIIPDYRATITARRPLPGGGYETIGTAEWDIVNVESDSQGQMTRLAVRMATI